MNLMTNTTALPAWFKKWNQFPIASGNWIAIRLPENERAILLSTQKAFNELMAFMPREHPSTEGKRRWSAARATYAKTHDEAALAELDRIGERGQILAGQLRERIHAIRDAGRRLAAARGCKAIYCHVFKLAV